jgi:hypothetical protein
MPPTDGTPDRREAGSTTGGHTMAITGVHGLLHTPQPEQLRRVLRDVLGWPHVDAGDGWLIFALPPAELGVHPAEKPHHEDHHHAAPR